MQDHLKLFLQNTAAQGIINQGGVEAAMLMELKKQVVSNHHYWQGTNGKWYTKVPDRKKGGKKLIKRSTEEGIKDAIFEYYLESPTESPTFEEAYYMWREVHDQLIVEKSARKYETDYLRFFKGTEFAGKEISKITDDDVLIFMRNTIQRNELGKESARKLFGYIANTFLQACKQKIITDNPIEFVKAKDCYKWCYEKIKTRDDNIVSDDDMNKLYCRLQEDYAEHPDYIPSYAVELAMLTAMRVGELAAMRWDKITDDYILIDQSEKSDSTEKEFWIDRTKNGKSRIFPMTDDIRELLERIKEVETQYGYLCEWVFANEKGRIHKNVISYCIKNKCRQLGIKQRGIHALRKTFNSNMRCNGVSSTVAASLLGHSTAVNEKYYTYDVTSLNEKTRIVSAVNYGVTSGNPNTCLVTP